MLITKYSPISRRYNMRDIPVTDTELSLWRGGMLIQHAMPNLSADDREFLMTGITPEEWEDIFGDAEDYMDDIVCED